MKKLFNLFRRRKPFNLEKALAGEPVVTRDGREVKDLHKSAFNLYPIRGYVDGMNLLFSIKGEFVIGMNDKFDLFMK